MTTGWVLIFAVLLLGGVIATVGDRLGMRVGKARLSLFKLRPRQTATLITILTGGLISASTLAVLLAVSDQLRTGLFELQNIQDDLETTRQDLEDATTEKEEVEDRLQEARQQRRGAQRQLEQINRSLQTSQERQRQTQGQLEQTQSRLQQIQSRFEQAQTLLSSVSRQAAVLQDEIEQLQSDRQELTQRIGQAENQVAQRNQQIAARDQEIASRQSQLEALEQQRTLLAQDVEILRQEYEGLRSGNVAVFRNQPLALGVLRVVNPDAAPEAVDQLLRQANRSALQRVFPGGTNRNQQVIQITNVEVEQLANQIKDGRDYLVRILSQGNYVLGEPCVLAGEPCVKVYATAFLNERVFSQNEIIASATINPPLLQDNSDLLEELNLLLSAVVFRAGRAGIPTETLTLANNDPEAVRSFLGRVKTLEQPIDIQVIAPTNISTVGPLQIELQAVQNGQPLFSTLQMPAIDPPSEAP
ncbi:DUF3084 domain-containing protein [Leptolyngbya sp. GB1-A1]|uniref:DUF3084 domain-containing protein n=1 Tax=unclassified Leptolyngbya TaxID=2650499 RepID=UPI00329A0A32